MASELEVKDFGSVHLHVSNSGVTFSIIDEGNGPTLLIASNAFGNLDHTFKVMLDKRSLLELAKLFTAASSEKYTDDYCFKASFTSQDKMMSDSSDELKKVS